ncbi:MAG: hypothetical protein ABIO70_02520 [Pseudomonadota bacterium]
MPIAFRALLLWLLLAPLLAGVAGASPGLDAVSDGDRAWFAADRRAAVACWRVAAEAGEPAAEAMAHLRLLAFSGNLGLSIHGPRIDRALAACPTEEPWCLLAEADYHLFAPAELGARREAALSLARRAQGSLPGPALARAWLAVKAPADLTALAAEERDGLGDGLVAHGGRLPAYPGTWLLGLAPVGGPGLGVGGGLHFEHPDLGLRGARIALEAGATSRGSAWLAAAGQGAGAVRPTGSLHVARIVQDLYDGETARTSEVAQARAAFGPGFAWGLQTLQLQAGPRLDRLDGDLLMGSGVSAAWALDGRAALERHGRGGRLGLGVTSALRPLGADYVHLSLSADARGYLRLGPAGTLAGRLLGERALLPEVPWFVLPSAGGADVLRGAAAGRYRGRSLVAADVEWRRNVLPALEGVLFLAGAWVEGTGAHPAGGGGIRLLLPPGHTQALRVDLGVSDAGWGVSTGWGEVF